MKLRDRVVVGFCLSLVLVTVLFVVDLQNENNRRLVTVENVAVGSGGTGGGDDVGIGVHGRYDRSRTADHAQFGWNSVWSTFMPSRDVAPDDPSRPRRPSAPQPYQQHGAHGIADDYSLVPDPYADDRFADLVKKVSATDSSMLHRGNVFDWTAVKDVIVDDTYEDGTISNEYVVEYLEAGLR